MQGINKLFEATSNMEPSVEKVEVLCEIIGTMDTPFLLPNVDRVPLLHRVIELSSNLAPSENKIAILDALDDFALNTLKDQDQLEATNAIRTARNNLLAQ